MVSIASYQVLTFEVELEISWKDVQALHSGTQREQIHTSLVKSKDNLPDSSTATRSAF